MKIEIILPYFNEKYGLELLKNTVDTLTKNKIKKSDINITRVPGALELPFTAQKIIKKKKPSAVIALGVIVRGDTSHYDLVCNETFRGLMDVQLRLNTPIIFGILTCENFAQVKKRTSKNGLNKGKSFAQAAIAQSLI